MCGICGIVNANPKEPVDAFAVRRMRDVLAHRGPDDAGLYIDGPAGLGMRRLSIIDLATGHQPMMSADGSAAVVFNGEIYNYLELRESCRQNGQQFATTSDTEVILRLYERYGEDCQIHMNGMFAFAVWDRRRQQLFLCRDRLGIKPLYYTTHGGAFFFASEIKSLLEIPSVRIDIDPTAIDEYMMFGFVQTPRTIFKNIYRLPEGHVLTWRSGDLRIRQYWDLTFAPTEAKDDSVIIEETKRLLQDAVELTLRSDVPVGVLLSGGLDSSAIAASVARSSKNLKTFSVGFVHGQPYNEFQYARQISRTFGTQHYEVLVDSSTFRDLVPRFVYHMDEPVADSAAIPLYLVSKAASQHVKVLLSGEGADELFAGYDIYEYMYWIERYRRIPQAYRTVWNRLMRRTIHSQKLDKYLFLSDRPLETRFLNTPLYDPRLPTRLYSPRFIDQLDGVDPLASIAPYYEKSRSWDLLSRMLYVDTKTWLPNALLMKADRMTMAASVELRVPFLDHRVVEHLAAVPSRMKLRRGRTKHLLREMMKDVLPHTVVNRSKMGFPTPLARMFRTELAGYCMDTLLSEDAKHRGYFDACRIENTLREHIAGEEDHAETIWRLLVLEEWHRCFIDSRHHDAPELGPSTGPSVADSHGAREAVGIPNIGM
jgi:asparagine synthase (glutamine-hydrolysing)